MKRLTFWISEQTKDHSCYNLVGRTRDEVMYQLAMRPDSGDYSKPKRVVLDYTDAFDLFERVTAEGGGRHAYY